MAGSEEKEKAVFDVDAASALVNELRCTFASGKTRSYEWRVTQLKNMLKMCDENEKEIAEALRQDLSKPELESVVYEIGMLKNSCRVALKEVKHWIVPEKAKTSLTTFPSSAEILSEPLGVVLIISAWNYPFLLSLDPLVGAIAAGNAVVLKPSEIAPASSSLLSKLLVKYLDSSAIRVIEGAVAETSALLEQKWEKIFYTGNGRVARIVMAAAAKHLTPVVLELGGKSPVVIDAGINLQVATRRIIAGKWGCNNGQACVSPDYIITTKDYAPELVMLSAIKVSFQFFLAFHFLPCCCSFSCFFNCFVLIQVDTLKNELERFYGKTPLESKDLSRIVNSNHFTRLTKLLDEDKVSGNIVHGGERDKESLKIAPTILLDVPQDSLIMNEEIFGPLLPIILVNKIEESFDLINSGTKPLAAYLFSNKKKLKEQFVMSVSAGGLVINDTTVHLAVDTLPFGGVGESGMGSYHGKFSFDAFSHKKAVLYRSFIGDAAIRYPPYTTEKVRLMKALIGGGIWNIIQALLGWGKA
ncbi:aldehyde dehydrogenase family 3 member H1 isoform X1 [Hevea brasiliensis]|uniref:aldehyde dehydrogenase family 3 member H1 isoform X1 n=1 Tax=Hevea brasiliensis TaxID=3981 RepID=UPI0025E9F4D6|nr:aldehyde dehydrogenase family 3 member H1 isoform X1 [Hevea brasiliensis]